MSDHSNAQDDQAQHDMLAALKAQADAQEEASRRLAETLAEAARRDGGA